MNSVTLPHLRRIRDVPRLPAPLPDQPIQWNIAGVWMGCVVLIAGFWSGLALLAEHFFK